MLVLNEVVAAKKKTTFLVPGELAAAFEQIAEPFGDKRKWRVHSAAVLLLLETPPEVLRAHIAAIAAADSAEDAGIKFEGLIERAKAKAKGGGGNRGGRLDQTAATVKGIHGKMDRGKVTSQTR